MKWGSQLGTHPIPPVEGASSWVGWSLNLLFHPMRQVWALWAISLNTAHTHTHTYTHRFLATLELLGTSPQGHAGEQGLLGQPVPWHWPLVSPHP